MQGKLKQQSQFKQIRQKSSLNVITIQQENAWKGTIDMFDNNGYDNDNWPGTTKLSENNATAQNIHGMIIHEPCNYASNMAYYKNP
jgi:hypothetical protein